MPQFLVIAHDGTDADAPSRRQAARPAHLEGIRPLVENGNIIAGGAILDDDGRMIGSALIAQFDSRTELDAWLSRDPYVTGDVWRQVEVMPYRLAVPELPIGKAR